LKSAGIRTRKGSLSQVCVEPNPLQFLQAHPEKRPNFLGNGGWGNGLLLEVTWLGRVPIPES